MARQIEAFKLRTEVAVDNAKGRAALRETEKTLIASASVLLGSDQR
jgi:hypothetical protein